MRIADRPIQERFGNRLAENFQRIGIGWRREPFRRGRLGRPGFEQAAGKCPQAAERRRHVRALKTELPFDVQGDVHRVDAVEAQSRKRRMRDVFFSRERSLQFFLDHPIDVVADRRGHRFGVHAVRLFHRRVNVRLRAEQPVVLPERGNFRADFVVPLLQPRVDLFPRRSGPRTGEGRVHFHRHTTTRSEKNQIDEEPQCPADHLRHHLRPATRIGVAERTSVQTSSSDTNNRDVRHGGQHIRRRAGTAEDFEAVVREHPRWPEHDVVARFQNADDFLHGREGPVACLPARLFHAGHFDRVEEMNERLEKRVVEIRFEAERPHAEDAP